MKTTKLKHPPKFSRNIYIAITAKWYMAIAVKCIKT